MNANPEFTHHYHKDLTPEQKAAEARIVESTYKILADQIDLNKEVQAANDRAWVLVAGIIIVTVVISVLAILFSYKMAYPAESLDVDRLATAIYYAEGGTKISHPYGILAHYIHTTPRQACINTINHALKDWNGKGDFIAFLGARYCPVGAKNDPTGLNKNWIKNVRRLYAKN